MLLEVLEVQQGPSDLGVPPAQSGPEYLSSLGHPEIPEETNRNTDRAEQSSETQHAGEKVSEISVSRDKKRHDRNQRNQRNRRRAYAQYLTPAYTPWRMEKSKRRAQ